MELYTQILDILKCLECNGTLTFENKGYQCKNCSCVYPIVNGIPRFTKESFISRSNENRNTEEKTKNYFGYEWDYFKDWGFIDDSDFDEQQKNESHGGSIEARTNAFRSKCRLSKQELDSSKYILDAGCGNGRYTYEAARQTKSLVIGVDLGYGSVSSAFENCSELDNVIIIQASLFNLPFKDLSLDACFSNGVLMHTGNAEKAFQEISRVISLKGVFVAHLYNRLNLIFEFNDFLLRSFTTRLSIEKGMVLARKLARLSSFINKLPNGFKYVNLFLRLQPTTIHMYDWYSAPSASHHNIDQLISWFETQGFTSLDYQRPAKGIFRPWSINVKGIKSTSDKK